MSAGIFTSYGCLRIRIIEVDTGPLRPKNGPRIGDYFVRVSLTSSSSVAVTTFSSRSFDCTHASLVKIDEEYMFFNASSAQILVISLNPCDNVSLQRSNCVPSQKTTIPVERLAENIEVAPRQQFFAYHGYLSSASL
jgi:hypothetical protein